MMDFVKVWKQITSKITIDEQELKHIFTDSLLPIFKLFIIDNHVISLGDMIDILIKKEPCINKLYAMKKHDYNSQPKGVHESPY